MRALYVRIKAFVEWFAGFHIPLYAANAAFYLILSLFPAVMLIVGMLPYIGYTQASLLNALRGLLPDVLMPLMERIVNDMSTNNTGVMLSITAVTAIWSSSRGVYCLQLGLNSINGASENRSYFFRRALCVVYMVFILAALMLTLVLHGFGREIASFCMSRPVPILQWIAKVLQFRGLLLMFLLTALFSAIFFVFPNKRMHFLSVVPGAALAALGWLVFTNLFSVYVIYSQSYSTLYGSLSVLAIGMFWLYSCMVILFCGAVFNLMLERLRELKK